MSNINYSEEFYINIKDKPKWVEGKPFEEQSKLVQDFYIEEAKKIRRGVTIGGVFLHPWLYWHVNTWSIMVDVKTKDGGIESISKRPELRDNEWLIQEALIKAKKEDRGIIGAGSRRIGKSAFISSFIGHSATTKYGGELRVNSVIGGSQKDLDNISSYISFGLNKIHPFFKMDQVGKDWSKGVTLGTRNADNSKDIFSTMTITNVDMGATKSSQKAAGATPNAMVFDEIGKFSFLKTFNTAKYSIATEFGWRTTPILLGCVCKGTEVYDGDGNLTTIENITKETGILGYGGSSKTKENIPWIQPPKQKLCISLETESGKVLKCSFDHPLLVIKGNDTFFVRANDLSAGDMLAVYDDNSTEKGFEFKDKLPGKGEYFKGKKCYRIIPDKLVYHSNIGLQDIYNLEAGTTHTYLTNGFISHNTSGEISEAQDLQKVINAPEAYNMIAMDWAWLDRRNNSPTWTKKVWGVFFPGQMSLDAGVPKKEIALSEYLDVKSPLLSKITIKESPWEESKDILNKRRNVLKAKDMSSYYDELMFIPMDPDDCFISSGNNPFPSAEAQRHKNRLLLSGDVGKSVDVFKKNGQNNPEIYYELSDKPIATFPFAGGILDCAIKIFEDPPENPEFNSTYVAGLDHYKHTESTGDSIGSLVIYKRMVNINDTYSNKIVCTYASRPPSIDTFNRTCEMLLEGYGAECLQENADISFQQYLEAKNKDVKLLANGEEIVKRLISGSARQVNKYGLSPTPKNKEYLLNLVIAYCWEVVTSYEDSKGNIHELLGIERITDIELLTEIIDYKNGINVDRITSFGHALVWARYLDDLRILPNTKTNQKLSEDKKLEYQKKRLEINMKIKSNPYARLKRR